MDTKAIAMTVVFAALAVVLNPALTGIGVPAPYAPFLIYQIWEIPIVAAFLLIGPKSGVSIALLNAVVLLAIFPGALPTGPLYNLAAVLSMLLGIYVAQRTINLKASRESTQRTNLGSGSMTVAYLTSLGIVFRVGVMTVFNYVVLRFPPPFGYLFPQQAIILALPLIALFNATLALYTIPIGHFLANTVRSSLKL
ncbi:hypothetical protein KAI12_02570 [Candidatus Bathyarchaeota archaeon]|nr:hypothetical protein [Candidatus Bathyarchaeota archaeon]